MQQIFKSNIHFTTGCIEVPAISVLRATTIVNRKWLILTPLENWQLWIDRQKFVTGDYVDDSYTYAKFGTNPPICANGKI